MEPNPDRNPPPGPARTAPFPASDRAHWTPSKQRVFLAALLETGSVAAAARAAGMSRSSAQRLRVRLAGTPFDRAWEQVLHHHARRLADPFAADALPPGRAPAASAPPHRRVTGA